jgi:hypothetical protein
MLAALVIYISSASFLDRIHAAKDGWTNCFFAEAKQLDRGNDTPALEQAVAAACHTEREAYVDAMLAQTDPKILSEVRPKDEALMDELELTMAHLAVMAAEHP